MSSEDWSLGAFNWPNCIGFNNTPFDHYMKYKKFSDTIVKFRPFQLRVESEDKYYDKDLSQNIKGV